MNPKFTEVEDILKLTGLTRLIFQQCDLRVDWENWCVYLTLNASQDFTKKYGPLELFMIPVFVERIYKAFARGHGGAMELFIMDGDRCLCGFASEDNSFRKAAEKENIEPSSNLSMRR